jgi:glycosyltransferase involved in cell wall biosynthesis
LVERGHDVTVIGYPGSEQPQWIRYTGKLTSPERPRVNWLDGRERKRDKALRYGFDNLKKFDANTKRALLVELVARCVPDCDVVISTLWETTATAFSCGKGIPAYFMQHFESVFHEPSELAYYQAEASYLLPVFRIANSSWLQQRVSRFVAGSERPLDIALCPNAVDLEHFHPDAGVTKLTRHERELNLISYGGRKVRWKGFQEMAEAVRIARQQLPDMQIHWNVYGEAELPPDNLIAPYTRLGFLKPAELAQQYCRNDVLLSASWYESFPLFPIEGMACGLAVITTAPGTEEYAAHGQNAMIVEPRNPASVASAIVELAGSPALRKRLGDAGIATAQQFNWDASVSRLESILHDLITRTR